MNLTEAIEWLNGERSWNNKHHGLQHHGPTALGDREVNIARDDAATTEQAYWIVRAHREGLVVRRLHPEGETECRET